MINKTSMVKHAKAIKSKQYVKEMVNRMFKKKIKCHNKIT